MNSKKAVVLNRFVKKKRWPYKQSTLISLVKEYPVIYNPFCTERLTEEFNEDEIWKEIALKMKFPSTKCKEMWTDIKYTFAKLMTLINTGKISKKDAILHPETGRYFDGRLHFLDPVYIADITDNDIPQSIHRLIDYYFDSRTKQYQMTNVMKSYSHAQVKALIAKRESNNEGSSDIMDTEFLQTLVDAAVKRKLQELNFLEETTLLIPSNDRNVIIDPSNNLPSTSNSNNNLGLESELIIEDDIKNENEADAAAYRPDQNMNTVNTDGENIEFVISDVSLNNDAIDRLEHDAQNIALTDNGPPLSDEYVRNFFKEMAQVTCLELSNSQQQMLRTRINNLVKDLLLKSDLEHHRSNIKSINDIEHSGPASKTSIIKSLLNDAVE